MADNNAPTPKSGALPPLPSSGMTGRLKSPTTQLPNKKGGAGKIVVMLSSVAKPAPAATQAIPLITPPAEPAATPPPAASTPSEGPPPPLPAKQVVPARSPLPQPQLSSTTFVKLPPKSSVPGWSSLSGKPVGASAERTSPANEATTPPLPAKWSEPTRGEPKRTGPQHIPPIKLNEPSADDNSPGESIFPEAKPPEPAPKPEAWKSLEPGEVNAPAAGLQCLEVFARSQDKPSPDKPTPDAKDKAAPLVAPPLRPPVRIETPAPMTSAMKPVLPPPLPKASEPAIESPTPAPTTIHVAPPLVEKAPESTAEKLPQPNLPAAVSKEEPAPSESGAVHKVPALIESETTPAKPLLPPAQPAAKVGGGWFKKISPLKKSTPLVVSSSSAKVQTPQIIEAKPALKPAVLPKRSLSTALEAASVVEAARAVDVPETPANADTSAALVPPPVPAAPAQPAGIAVPPSVAKAEPAAEVSPSPIPPAIPVSPKTKTTVPLTRAERAKKRHFVQTIIFWAVLFPLAIAALLAGSLYFGRETVVEGQVIPPQGMTLSNEVWIVSNFGDLASGIAEDLAAERTPLLQEIQERQDHVQRAQGDIASREERIRLIQEEIQAAKDEIVNIVKQSRDATQQIWDGEGAQIDGEYTSRLNDLQKLIADRAKSLNLKYQPDPSYPSPEVWANAYRLALYEVPAGVDSVKEHQWLSDQMKQWRDFLKTLDDRKEQLREKAAQLKLAPAPKINDLNTKIDDLQQRSDATAAEEVPLKAELQQAQVDLAQAQAADAGLDDKYYKQLYSLPAEAVIKHIPLASNGRFTWVDDDPFVEGEKEHHYLIFVRATRADGRQYWALHHFNIARDQTLELYIEPTGFISTKAILRPNLSPEEQEQ